MLFKIDIHFPKSQDLDARWCEIFQACVWKHRPHELQTFNGAMWWVEDLGLVEFEHKNLTREPKAKHLDQDLHSPAIFDAWLNIAPRKLHRNLPYSGSSEIIMSVSTLACIIWPSVLRLTVPLIPIKQCSCTKGVTLSQYVLKLSYNNIMAATLGAVSKNRIMHAEDNLPTLKEKLTVLSLEWTCSSVK